MEINRSVLVLLAIIVSAIVCVSSDLVDGFYGNSCPQAETIVKRFTEKSVTKNPNMPAKLLRLHFHDCFVRGCDGSVLLNSTQSEKTARTNAGLAGFDVIDKIKEEVETECSGIVSCADILALAARDAVSYQYGRPLWKVLTGRRDGNVSLATEAQANLPGANSNFAALKKNFESKNLSVLDVVTLSGAHTIGVGHCGAFRRRLYNFTGVGDTDPSLDSTYADFLKTKCPNNSSDTTTTVEMDPNSSKTFEDSYYNILLQNKGLFVSDAALLTDQESSGYVQQLRDSDTFFQQFAASMLKMGDIGVLTGDQGEIRKICSSVN